MSSPSSSPSSSPLPTSSTLTATSLVALPTPLVHRADVNSPNHTIYFSSGSTSAITSPSALMEPSSNAFSQVTSKVSYATITPREVNSPVPTDLSVVDLADFTSSSSTSSSRPYLDINEAPSPVVSQITVPSSSVTTSAELNVVTAPAEIPSEYKTVTFTQCQSDAVVVSTAPESGDACTALYGLVPPDFSAIPTAAEASAITTTITGASAGNTIITIVIPANAASTTSTEPTTAPSVSTSDNASSTSVMLSAETLSSDSATSIKTNATPTSDSPSSSSTDTSFVASGTRSVPSVATTTATITTLTWPPVDSSSKLSSSPTVVSNIGGKNNDTRGSSGDGGNGGNDGDSGDESGDGQHSDSVSEGDLVNEAHDENSGTASVLVNAIVWPIVGVVTLAGIGLLVATLL
ncbi:hypothetical protein Cpir12675_002878 [Ceratocystis pirilliformis]|uniref:Uncharacterized protein n=1 Tax=Ceratocystis pirilliformis TaxID=259994 RepID=A0ABR3Z7S2_9PEZI